MVFSLRTAAWLLVCLCLIGFQPALADGPKEVPPTFTPPPSVEAWRVRIENAAAGAVEVSIDHGRTWSLLGRVVQPATQHLMGYLAAGYAPIGTVAATAVHGIRIRVGDTSSAYPLLINILPAQFAQTPNYFGGHVSGESGIYTDIPAGVGLFREFAPLVGSQVTVASGDQPPMLLPVNYAPENGDVLTIIVRRPVNPLREIIFENKPGGNVTVTYADGSSTVVTHVLQPVRGIGRFDGTSYTGVGAINTNHTCVITVSTAPVSDSPLLEGDGDERRGGFQIVPAWHISQTEEAGAPQMMALGSPNSPGPTIEGTPPLFYGNLSLSWSPDDPDHSWICQIERTGDTDWQSMPTLIGNLPDALAKLNVIAIRISRKTGYEDGKWIARQLADDVVGYQDMRKHLAEAGKEPVTRGTTEVAMRQDVPTGAYAQLLVDGDMVGLTNSRPYTFDWDTLRVRDGEHMVESKVVDDNGKMIADERQVYYVDNARALSSPPVQTSSSAAVRPLVRPAKLRASTQ